MSSSRIMLLLALGSAISLLGCSKKPDPVHPDGYETLTLRYEGSPGSVSPVELAEDLGYLGPIKLEYVGANITGGPHSLQAVVSGDIDIGGSFNGAIAKLVASRAPLKAVIAAYGTDEESFQGFYALSDSPIQGPKDLVGKKVSMNTLGAHAEFALREYLRRGGLTPEQVKEVALIALPAANGELSLREKQVEVAILGNIHRLKAVARGGVRKIGSDFELFGTFNGGSYVMSSKFLEKNPNTARKFVEGVGRAIDWSRSQPRANVIARMEQIIGKRGRNEDTSIVKHWIGYGIGTKSGLLAVRDFQIWLDWLQRDGQIDPGSKLRAEDVFTNDFQPPAQSASLHAPVR